MPPQRSAHSDRRRRRRARPRRRGPGTPAARRERPRRGCRGHARSTAAPTRPCATLARLDAWIAEARERRARRLRYGDDLARRACRPNWSASRSRPRRPGLLHPARPPRRRRRPLRRRPRCPARSPLREALDAAEAVLEDPSSSRSARTSNIDALVLRALRHRRRALSTTRC